MSGSSIRIRRNRSDREGRWPTFWGSSAENNLSTTASRSGDGKRDAESAEQKREIASHDSGSRRGRTAKTRRCATVTSSNLVARVPWRVSILGSFGQASGICKGCTVVGRCVADCAGSRVWLPFNQVSNKSTCYQICAILTTCSALHWVRARLYSFSLRLAAQIGGWYVPYPKCPSRALRDFDNTGSGILCGAHTCPRLR